MCKASPVYGDVYELSKYVANALWRGVARLHSERVVLALQDTQASALLERNVKYISIQCCDIAYNLLFKQLIITFGPTSTFLLSIDRRFSQVFLWISLNTVEVRASMVCFAY